MSQRISFFGAARTVTGSRHLLELNGKKILIDCGIFQGSRELKERNWIDFPVPPHEIDLVIATHAHLDHIGWLPRLVKHGYRGKILATPATIGLARISLPDSGRLQEEEARHANKHGYSRHRPALPLYTEDDAYACLKHFEPVHYFEFRDLPGKGTFQFMPAGHILGSAFAEIYFENGERILMSGDLGRYNTPIIKDPSTVEYAEYLVLESTYGDRRHADEPVLEKLEAVLKRAYETQGAVLVPSFSIGRTQELMYYLKQLQNAGRMPRIPVFLDSPMAVSATALYAQCKEEHDRDMKIAVDADTSPLDPDYLTLVRDRNQSKALNAHPGPVMIIAGSGMANGGRIVHHLLHRLHDPATIVLFTGYQAEGTLGRELLEGAEQVEIHRKPVHVLAQVEKLNALSAHADQGELIEWLRNFKQEPRKTFLVHGEPHAQDTLQEKIRQELGWNVEVPEFGQTFEL